MPSVVSPLPHHPFVAVIGSGPAGLIAALRLAESGCRVVIYDRMAAPARKLLMAGASGLNLTHAEPLEIFLDRYGAARAHLEGPIRAFDPTALRGWAEDLGQPCFTGSSGRVFPRAMKASPLLRAWLARLAASGVRFMPRHEWQGWEGAGPALRFATPHGRVTVEPAATLLALGGASWSRLGADGAWTRHFPETALAPFRPSNCGFVPSWPKEILERWEGNILKGVRLDFAGASARGDVTVTRNGLEGAPLYALSGPLREAIARTGVARLTVDLQPTLEAASIVTRLERVRPRESLANRLRKGAALTPFARAVLLAEGGVQDLSAGELAGRIKAAPLLLAATEPMERAISVAGGLRFEAMDPCFMLRDRPGVFAAGEMLDWEAPTGGYLLQACFATGHAAAAGALAWLQRNG